MAITSFAFGWSFLSNFHPCEITHRSLTFPSVENAYQAAKCAIESDRLRFMYLPAGKAKRLGRTVPLREDWEYIKIDVMRELISLKFEEGSELAGKLIDTGNEELIEGNSWGDRFWGVYKGKGANHLGRLLMERRVFLRDKEL